MRCTILASGSNGNCACIEGESGTLLIDAGLSRREILARLAVAGCIPGEIRGILVTHEHGDHIAGLDVLSRSLDAPAHATEGTLHAFLTRRRSSKSPIRTVKTRIDEAYGIADFTVEPFATSHDAAEPCGWVVAERGIRIGCCTDTGILTDSIVEKLSRCDLVILESNHCPDMLKNGPYPEVLKRRIRGKKGHLSNADARDGIRTLGMHVHHIVLAHLSEVNNTPEKAMLSAREGAGLYIDETSLSVAPRADAAPFHPVWIRL
jgi:phosphoribosyl 1,2-cyclic phosphodiesterase